MNIGVNPVLLQSNNEIAKKIQVGDLVFTKMNKGFDEIDSFIVLMQKIMTWMYPNTTNQQCDDYVHVAIVVEVNTVGQVLLAEAMPTKKHKKDLRIVDLLSDTSYALEKNKKYSYEIIRLNDPTLQQFIPQTVKIAKKLATKASYLMKKNDQKKECKIKKSCFSFWNGVKAIFTKQSKEKEPLNAGSTKRIFKQIWDQIQSSYVAVGGGKPRKFFCASFVGYLLQASEANNAWNTLKTKYPSLNSPDFSKSKIKKPVSMWAKQMAKQHGKELNELMINYRFDAKKIGPGALRAFLNQKKITSFFL